jgi:chemotaxis protein CheX
MATHATDASPIGKSVVDAIQSAVQTTYTKFCKDTPRASATSLSELDCDCVAGIISFFGDVSLSVAWVFDGESAPALAQQFARFPIPFDSPEMGDVAGELVNVLAGDILINLEARGSKVKMSLPTVARGNRLRIMPEKGVCVTHLNYVSDNGRFWLRIATTSKP